MSNLVVDTLTNQDTQLCKAWVNFNGTSTVAIRGSYNVSSITDNGTGDYTVNFTTAMPDANYSISGSVAVRRRVWRAFCTRGKYSNATTTTVGVYSARIRLVWQQLITITHICKYKYSDKEELTKQREN
jgi:hypothetical protein